MSFEFEYQFPSGVWVSSINQHLTVEDALAELNVLLDHAPMPLDARIVEDHHVVLDFDGIKKRRSGGGSN
jgi:hypothetical protein